MAKKSKIEKRIRQMEKALEQCRKGAWAISEALTFLLEDLRRRTAKKGKR